MMVFRLSRAKFAGDLSGKGAEMAGSRWNSKGVAMLYTSGSVALCVVELAVHLPLGLLPADFYLTTLFIPERINIEEIQYKELPSDWKKLPHSSSTQKAGDLFVTRKSSPVLKVPSAIVPAEYNYLINPLHPESKKIEILSMEPFEFDQRLFVR